MKMLKFVLLVIIKALLYSSLHLKAHQSKELPNINWISVGYNIIRGNPFFPRDKAVDPGLTANKLFTITHEKQVPIGEEYISPDSYTISIERSIQTLTPSLFVNIKKLKKKMNASIGVDKKFGFMSFVAEQEFKNMREKLNGDKCYVTCTAKCVLYSATMEQYNPPEFSPAYLQALQSLGNATFESNPNAYYDLFEVFGTHFLSQITMGSQFSNVQEMEKKSLKNLKSQKVVVKDQAIHATLNMMYAQNGLSYDHTVNPNFITSVTTSFSVLYGKPMPVPVATKDNWYETTKEGPLPISFQIKPINEMVNQKIQLERLQAKGIRGDIIAKSMEKALDPKNYCSYLKEKGFAVICIPPKVTPPPQRYERDTRETTDGNGSILLLSQHKADCQLGSALSSFRYLKEENSKIKYKYSCTTHEAISKECNSGRKELDYELPESGFILNQLVNIPVDCEEGRVLKQFNFGNERKKIFYEFTCCNAKVTNCESVETLPVGNTDNSSFSLRGLKPSVGKISDVIKGFQLIEDNDGKLRYKLDVCTLKLDLS